MLVLGWLFASLLAACSTTAEPTGDGLLDLEPPTLPLIVRAVGDPNEASEQEVATHCEASRAAVRALNVLGVRVLQQAPAGSLETWPPDRPIYQLSALGCDLGDRPNDPSPFDELRITLSEDGMEARLAWRYGTSMAASFGVCRLRKTAEGWQSDLCAVTGYV
jgi:hypothetical protein